MKVAILTTGNFEDMKGIMNYVQEKARRYKNIENDHVKTDVFFLINRLSFVLKFIYKCFGRSCPNGNYKSGECVEKDGVRYILIVRKVSILDVFYTMICNQFVPNRAIKKIIPILEEYDIISTHQLPCHFIAEELKKRCNIPYITTWHGSDINISPKQSKRILETTKHVMEHADMNYFVSKGLLKASDYISTNARKDYIYTGPSSIFRKFSIEEKNELRKKYNISNKKVIMFVGNLIPVKNVMLLPHIFSAVSKKNKNLEIEYWIIGDGFQHDDLERELSQLDVDFKMLGKKDPCDMPIYMNVADVLVVPSKNEGFSLVTLEARTCGCYVVASNVGGLPESVGEENCFPLGENFITNISDKIIDVLQNDRQAEVLSDEMSWKSAINKELSEMKRILKHKNRNGNGY